MIQQTLPPAIVRPAAKEDLLRWLKLLAPTAVAPAFYFQGCSCCGVNDPVFCFDVLKLDDSLNIVASYLTNISGGFTLLTDKGRMGRLSAQRYAASSTPNDIWVAGGYDTLSLGGPPLDAMDPGYRAKRLDASGIVGDAIPNIEHEVTSKRSYSMSDSSDLWGLFYANDRFAVADLASDYSEPAWYIRRVNHDGTIVWQRAITDENIDDYLGTHGLPGTSLKLKGRLLVDGAGNSYALFTESDSFPVGSVYEFRMPDTTGPINSAMTYSDVNVINPPTPGTIYYTQKDYIISLDEDGNIRWIFFCGGGGYNSVTASITDEVHSDISISSSGTICYTYRTKIHETSPSSDIVEHWTITIDSDGNELWRNTSIGGYCCRIDELDNVYVGGRETIGGYNLWKIDSGGTMTWRKTFDSVVYDLAVDSGHHVLAVGSGTGTGGTYAFVRRYDSTGNLNFSGQWSSDIDGFCCDVDSNDDWYVGVTNTCSGTYSIDVGVTTTDFCTYCPVAPVYWTLTISGVTNDLCSGCSAYDGSWTLTHDGADPCNWNGNFQSPAAWTYPCGVSPSVPPGLGYYTFQMELTSVGMILNIYSNTTTSTVLEAQYGSGGGIVCLGVNTLYLVYSNPALSCTWPSTVEIEPA